MFSQQLKAPARGAAARQDKLSPLDEMTNRQLETYSAPQLAIILRQHEEAISRALTEHHGPFIPPAGQKPYLERPRDECKITLCSACGRAGAGEDMSFLSIDGVLKGDIPPSAAVGYGFRGIGGRPVANTNTVKNLGRRDLKTGLLPHQEQKTKEEGERETGGIQNNSGKADKAANCKMLKITGETSASAGPKQTERASKAVQTDGPEAQGFVELNTSLNVDDKEASAAVEPDDLMAHSDNFAEADVSNEEVIQFYADSIHDAISSNRAWDAEGGAIEEGVVSPVTRPLPPLTP